MYLLEGNIGAGKSTFLQLIKKHLPHLQVFFEPINNWQNDAQSRSLLQNFYTDTQRWAYTMENFTLINRIIENIKLKNPDCAIIAERSIYSGYYCFARNSYLNGFMSKLEWGIYESWFNFLTNHHTYPKPTGFIYLRTTPSTAYSRVIKRNRQAESLISFDYINQVHIKHEELLLNQSIINAPILVLDANNQFESDMQALQTMLSAVDQFISASKELQSPVYQQKLL